MAGRIIVRDPAFSWTGLPHANWLLHDLCKSWAASASVLIVQVLPFDLHQFVWEGQEALHKSIKATHRSKTAQDKDWACFALVSSASANANASSGAFDSTQQLKTTPVHSKYNQKKNEQLAYSTNYYRVFLFCGGHLINYPKPQASSMIHSKSPPKPSYTIYISFFFPVLSSAQHGPALPLWWPSHQPLSRDLPLVGPWWPEAKWSGARWSGWKYHCSNSWNPDKGWTGWPKTPEAKPKNLTCASKSF